MALGLVWTVSACVDNPFDSSEANPAADDITGSESSANDRGKDGVHEAAEATEPGATQTSNSGLQPHEMTHWNNAEVEWYEFSPQEYPDATDWSPGDDSPEYETESEDIANYSCGLGKRHFQGTWSLQVPIGNYVPDNYEVIVDHFEVYEGGDTRSSLPEVQVFLSIGCSTWISAVENTGVNPDLYPRQIVISEESAKSLLDLENIALAVSLGELRDPTGAERLDIRSEDIGEVYYRLRLYPDE